MNYVQGISLQRILLQEVLTLSRHGQVEEDLDTYNTEEPTPATISRDTPDPRYKPPLPVKPPLALEQLTSERHNHTASTPINITRLLQSPNDLELYATIKLLQDIDLDEEDSLQLLLWYKNGYIEDKELVPMIWLAMLEEYKVLKEEKEKCEREKKRLNSLEFRQDHWYSGDTGAEIELYADFPDGVTPVIEARSLRFNNDDNKWLDEMRTTTSINVIDTTDNPLVIQNRKGLIDSEFSGYDDEHTYYDYPDADDQTEGSGYAPDTYPDTMDAMYHYATATAAVDILRVANGANDYDPIVSRSSTHQKENKIESKFLDSSELHSPFATTNSKDTLGPRPRAMLFSGSPVGYLYELTTGVLNTIVPDDTYWMTTIKPDLMDRLSTAAERAPRVRSARATTARAFTKSQNARQTTIFERLHSGVSRSIFTKFGRYVRRAMGRYKKELKRVFS